MVGSFFFSSRRRHTRCALVTGVQTCALPISAQQLTTGIKRFAMDGDIPGYESWEDAVAAMPAIPVADERAGVDMLYSSGTTGRPKGVRVPLPEDPAIDAANSLVMLASAVFPIGRASCRERVCQYV